MKIPRKKSEKRAFRLGPLLGYFLLIAIKELDTRGQKRQIKIQGREQRGKERQNPEMINYICKFNI